MKFLSQKSIGWGLYFPSLIIVKEDLEFQILAFFFFCISPYFNFYLFNIHAAANFPYHSLQNDEPFYRFVQHKRKKKNHILWCVSLTKRKKKSKTRTIICERSWKNKNRKMLNFITFTFRSMLYLIVINKRRSPFNLKLFYLCNEFFVSSFCGIKLLLFIWSYYWIYPVIGDDDECTYGYMIYSKDRRKKIKNILIKMRLENCSAWCKNSYRHIQ